MMYRLIARLGACLALAAAFVLLAGQVLATDAEGEPTPTAESEPEEGQHRPPATGRIYSYGPDPANPESNGRTLSPEARRLLERERED